MEDWRHLFHLGVNTLLLLGVLTTVIFLVRLGVYYISGAQKEMLRFNDAAVASKQGEYNDTVIEGSEVILALTQSSEESVKYYYVTLSALHSIPADQIPADATGEARTASDFLAVVTSAGAPDANTVSNSWFCNGANYDSYISGVYDISLGIDNKFYVNPEGKFFAHQFLGPGSVQSVIFIQEEL